MTLMRVHARCAAGLWKGLRAAGALLPIVGRTRRPLLTGAMLVIPLPALAAHAVLGEIRAVLDGEPRTWRMLHSAEPGQDYNTHVVSSDNAFQVTLHGYEEETSATREVLVIDLAVVEASLEPLSETVLYIAEGSARLWTSLVGEPVVTVTRFDPETGIEGILSGRLCLREGLLAEPDPEACLTIEGDFASVFPPED